MARRRQRQQQPLRVWQWNCRGLGRKRGNLQLHIRNAEHMPDVLAFQESHDSVHLSGYVRFEVPVEAAVRGPRASKPVHTFVRKGIPTIQHEPVVDNGPHILLELLPRRKEQRHVFLLNVYSPPKDQSKAEAIILAEVLRVAKDTPLLVVGDFNANHAEWGHLHTLPKAVSIQECVDEHDYTILNDFRYPTRNGNSVSRNTTPDLSMTRKIGKVSWTNTGVSLGSDHYVLEMLLPVEGISAPAKRKVLVTDWDAFRRNRNASAPTTIEELRGWIDDLLSSAELVTVESNASSTSGVSDSKLWHMWQAHRSLQARWQAQARRNGKLRRRIARLERDIEIYADQLDRQQWGQVCDGLNGNLHRKDTWSLLRHLTRFGGPTTTKTAQRTDLSKVLHSHGGSTADLMEELRNTYLPVSTEHEEASLSYTGSPNPELDDDIIEAEVRSAMEQLRAKSAPGSHRITNKMLRNLDDRSVTALTALFNEVWRTGSVPPTWKHAVVAFIPKPGKELSVSNLRPISLTSCLGKLLEHVILNRLQAYVEDRDLLPHTSFGFRAHLSTQDVFLQLSQDIVEKKRGMQALLALDLQKAFDNVKREAILNRISRLHLGLRTFAYVKSFLTGRTTEIRLGEDVSPTFRACVGREKLTVIPGLHHSLYADDVTLWTEGHVLQVQSALQTAADVVVDYARSVGLECSHAKSELLVKRGYHERIFQDEVQVLVNGNRISESDSVRVLGMHLRKDLSNTDAILRICKTAKSTARLIRRIATKRGGVKEGDVCRIVHAFVVSRVLYTVPYMRLTTTDKKKLDSIIRQVYKLALGLPMATSTDRLMQLGIHNTVSELVEAHRSSQIVRLSKTPTGRAVLDRLGIEPEPLQEAPVDVPKTIRKVLEVRPVPRNMHPQHHEERRKARAEALDKQHRNNSGVLHVDAAPYPGGASRNACFAIAVVNSDGSTVAQASVTTKATAVGEEAAVALALVHAGPLSTTITSDSKTAVRNFARGRVCAPGSDRTRHRLVCVPAHSTHEGNKTAHATATRATSFRMPAGTLPSFLSGVDEAASHHLSMSKDCLTVFQEILQPYRLERRVYPPPDKSLTKFQALRWRQLQTNTLPCPAFLRHIYPTVFDGKCARCPPPDHADGGTGPTKATIAHLFWECPFDPPSSTLRDFVAHLREGEEDPQDPPWTVLLRSSDPHIQAEVVSRAERIATEITKTLQKANERPTFDLA
ncbi:hypothetical protein HPB47_019171 [Ixodes persulcatus]|uniref:Uncharacterized protein n=1 Tax=Ixodes persulcatus TaxID=34615 RepID=A0AC60QJP7_IXOPE|nr:hypothetical protein HPB47_019171 [Ixodes persulcatus]